MNSQVTGLGDAADFPKESIPILGFKQRVLSIDMKTKLIQHVESD